MRLGLQQKVGLSFVLALGGLLICTILLNLLVGSFSKNGQWVAHTYEVLTRLRSLSLALSEAESARRGIILTSDSAIQKRFSASTPEAEALLEEIARLTSDNPVQKRAIGRLKPVVERKLQLLTDSVQLWTETGQPSMQRQQQLTLSSDRTGDEIRSIIALMSEEELRLLGTRNRAVARTRWITAISVNLLCALALVITAASYHVIVGEIHSGKALQRKTEVANVALKDFAYTVSHDLRLR